MLGALCQHSGTESNIAQEITIHSNQAEKKSKSLYYLPSVMLKSLKAPVSKGPTASFLQNQLLLYRANTTRQPLVNLVQSEIILVK